MPTDALKIKRQPTARGNFTPEEADDLVDAFFHEDDPVVTRSVLKSEMRRQTLAIAGLVFAMNSMFLAAAAFLLG